MLRALRRLVAYEGSIAAVARTLGMKRQRLSRWLSHGIPARDLEGRRVEELLAVLYARFSQLDKDSLAAEARERKIQASKDAEELLRQFVNKRARKKLVDAIRGWVERYSEIARFRKMNRSGAQWFADELGVRVDLVRAATKPGEESMSVKLFQAFRAFEKSEEDQAIEDEIDREKMIELMKLASVPEKRVVVVERTRRVRRGGRWVRETVQVEEEREEPVIPKVPNGSWEFSGEGTQGQRWGQKIGEFLAPRIHRSGRDGWRVIQRFAEFAAGVPGLGPAWRFPEWSVYLMASELGDSAIHGSAGPFRQLGTEDDNRFVVSEAYSSGNQHGSRAKARAIVRFIEKIGKGLDGGNLIYAHGGIAWNYRKRGDDEKKRLAKVRKENWELQKTLREVRARVKSDAQKKRAKKIRRKKTLEAVMARRAEKKGSRS